MATTWPPIPPNTFSPNIYSLGFKAGQTLQTLYTLGTQISWKKVYDNITSFPAFYKHWWLDLFANDPIHVFVETTLLISIIVMLLANRINKKKYNKQIANKGQLTKLEEEELLYEWKMHTRAPLVPLQLHEEQYNTPNDIMIEKVQGKMMTIQLDGISDSIQAINFCNLDFLGMSSHSVVQAAAKQALDKYGCGSCGPRGFYGTIDVHLQLEEYFAKTIMKTEQAILYSDAASMCTSTVAAFAKRGDLLVVDAAVYEPLLTGVTLSRAHVRYFAHNDMQDLRRILMEVQANDRKIGRKPNAQRRFIVAEGLYKNTGSICKLDELVALKHEFAYRLILDESHSFGSLGPTGRGALELHGKQIMKDAEIVTVSLENAVGSIGGMTVGSDEVVDHQRLSGSGYCFSAAAPPFTATAALASLQFVQEHPDVHQRLQDNCAYMYEKLKTWCKLVDNVVVVHSDERSHLVMLRVADSEELEDLDSIVFCEEVVRECLLHKVAFCATNREAIDEASAPPPIIRITLSAAHSHADIDKALVVLAEAVHTVLDRFYEEGTN
ncbi:hypothetical protein MPSEU_000548300 [Mayamaea pseudoterrestris]|nr:hypothetical protein MPSEU_000548300 [Mayamaea pseudoterrestris]